MGLACYGCYQAESATAEPESETMKTILRALAGLAAALVVLAIWAWNSNSAQEMAFLATKIS